MSAVRLATTADRAAVVGVLSRAFQDDPVLGWILPDATKRARALPRLFGAVFDGDAWRGMRLITAGDEATTLWRAPGEARDGLLAMLRSVPAMVAAFGAALPRALAVANAIEAHLPAGDYWYLHFAACDPAAQGKGHGGTAVRAGLTRAAGRLPCYLETGKEKNVGFYRAMGWELTGEWRVRDDGPRFWSMLRQPG